MNDALKVIDEMIEETVGQPRGDAKPVMGGSRQVPFDGALLGKFIRFTVLSEVRMRITGDERSLDDIKADFKDRVGDW